MTGWHDLPLELKVDIVKECIPNIDDTLLSKSLILHLPQSDLPGLAQSDGSINCVIRSR